MRWLEKLASVALAAVILSSVGYTYERERDLNPIFQDMNRQYFGGNLSHVRAEYAVLDNNRGETTDMGDGWLILVNRHEPDVRQVLRHEGCHVQVGDREHGQSFQECIKRFD